MSIQPSCGARPSRGARTTRSSSAAGATVSRRRTTSAAQHGLTDVSCCERSWLGGGNMGRNTTIIRSNYLWDESAAIYEHCAAGCGRGWQDELDYDLLFDQRGVLNLAHNLRTSARAGGASRRTGSTASTRSGSITADVAEFGPSSTRRRTCATRCSARRCSAAAAIARHDHVALGVCARRVGPRRRHACRTAPSSGCCGRRPGHGRADRARADQGRPRRARRRRPHVACSRTGGRRLPLQSHPLQALVSGLLEEVLRCVVMSNAVHVYVSQARQGRARDGRRRRR